MLEPGNAGKKLEDFLGAEHDRQLLRLLGQRKGLWEDPRLVEGDFVEKADTAMMMEVGASFFSFTR